MADQKNALIFYWEWADIFFKELQAEEAKSLLLAIVDLDRNGEEPAGMESRSGEFRMAFNSIRGVLSRNRDKYEETCRKRQEAAKARWLKENPNKSAADYEKEVLRIGSSTKQHANACDSDNESDNEHERDLESGIERGNERDKESGKGKGAGGTIGGNQKGKQKKYGYWTEEQIKQLCVENNKPFGLLTESMKENIGKATNDDEGKAALLRICQLENL